MDEKKNDGATRDPAGTASEEAPLLPGVTWPKGGGAIRGIGEKFAANPATGSGSMTVPLAVSPGRSGFGPQLSLAYDSGTGNGPFGFGWSLSLPRIRRKTDKGLPRYRDAEESDVFLLSGAEDLVPLLLPDKTRHEDTATWPGFIIHCYRPRVEGLFARIERWTETATGDVHWRSISRDNITTLYGRNNRSRVFDPGEGGSPHPRRVFEWLICESYDDKGNAMVYEYADENDVHVDQGRASERNRVRTANRYLKRIQYGNRVSRLVQPDLAAAEWLFEVVFDYDEGHYEALPPTPDKPVAEQHRYARASVDTTGKWAVRPDPFSVYRSGFEVRSYRRCRRVLMFHRFTELGSEPCLVKATELDYEDLGLTPSVTVEDELAHPGSTRFASFIRRVTHSGYVRDAAAPVEVRDGLRYVRYLQKSLPPLEFEYSQARIQADVRELDEDSQANLPIGVDGASDQWVDLDGEGLPGVLTKQGGAWHYKPNLGDGRLGATQVLRTQPSLCAEAGGEQLLDLSGDGQLDVVTFAGPTPGFYERTHDQRWESFRTFRQLPNIRWDDPNTRFIDLSGDGHADVLITEDEVLTWYPSLQEEGFGPARHVRKPWDEEKGPRLVFADGTQAVYLADMNGDGLTDLVRIRNGEACYWPNLGYGLFGARVTMDNAPWFDAPDQFDQRRLRLADIDGSGANDLLYLGRDGVRLYFNQSGNAWSAARPLPGFPRVDDLSSVMTADLLGNGTACLAWSSPLPGDARRPLRYIDLMGGQKPHLLVRSINNLGAETHVQYAPSTKFYLRDKLDGKPWITKLPFPVHVVERVETYDRISHNRFVTRYTYHHGYFDGHEREFRGFGLVEQLDTEELAALRASNVFPAGANIQDDSHVPPVLTKTWFHTGVYLGRDHVSNYFAGLLDAHDTGEYFREPGLTDAQARDLALKDTVLPPGLTADEEREACRALRGSLLRQEVYALDNSDRASLPYAVTERNYGVRCLQGRGGNRHAVFLKHAGEVIGYSYERTRVPVLGGQLVDEAMAATNPSVERLLDPRVSHSLTLEVDDFGNVLKSATVGYGRRFSAPSLPLPVREEQSRTYVTCTENRVTNPIDGTAAYRAPLAYEVRTYELTGYAPSGPAGRFRREDFVAPGPGAPGSYVALFDDELEYQEAPTSGRQRRLIEHVRTLFRRDDLVDALPLGRLESRALPFEAYKLALTPGLVQQVFAGRVTDAMLDGTGSTPGGRYVHTRDENGTLGPDWWTPSGQVFFSPGASDTAAQELGHARAHFFLPHRARDPFHTAAASTESFVEYDAHDLMVRETRSPLGNRVTVGERHVDPTQPPVRHGHDYRVLQPVLVMDANRNRTAIAFDALGLVAGTAVMGKPEDSPAVGDRLTAAFRPDLTQAELEAFAAAPRGPVAAQLLADATTRFISDLTAYWREPDLARKPPASAATLARETHVSEPLPPGGLRIQTQIAYSDGFCREIQRKAQAEPGPVPIRDAGGAIVVGADNQPQMTSASVSPRWVGTGWTVFNNKGKPVRQYEPYFTDTHRFEFDVRIGKSPIRFYDPVDRLVATLHPNHTWEKVVFAPWRQATCDVSDTVLVTTPQADADVHDFFARLPSSEYLPTWHARRSSGALGPHEQAAALKSELYAATPSVAHTDSLGRTLVTVAHNRFKQADAPAGDPPTEEFYASRVVFDIEGNQREVIDAKDRVVVRYEYDLLGNRIHQSSMEAGQRWLLNDVAGKSLYTWDSRGHRSRTAYDVLQRPTASYLAKGAGPELLVGRGAYGESRPAPEARNLRGKRVELFDQAGVVTSDDYDFKGNLLRTSRRLVDTMVSHGQSQPAYKTTVDWSGSVTLGLEAYLSQTRYDALNRPIQVVAPRGNQPGARINVIQPGYNEANLLERMDVWLGHGSVPVALIDPATQAPAPVGIVNIDYDARAQRLRVDYKNGVSTRYRYDVDTFRLIQLYTWRGATFTGDCDNPQPPPATLAAPEEPPPGTACGVQNLHYTHDAAGNVTHLHDSAQQAVYFSNAHVDPSADYTYDAVFRLLEATGREHLGQVGGPPIPHAYNDVRRVGLQHPNDGNAMGRYLERYVYDAAGNLSRMQHRGTSPSAPGWSRSYTYSEPSQLEAGKYSNRLTSTTVGDGTPITETYSAAGDGYDAHGNMLKLPQLQLMQWSEGDRLQMTQRQAVNPSDSDGVQRQGERTWYVYDAGGQRIRKVTELANGQVKDERLYLGGFEVYRKPGANGLVRETLHLMDDKQRIAVVETRTQGTETGIPAQLIRYQHGNHLGSTSLELDDQARVLSYEEYTPFGSTSYQAVQSQTQVPKRYRYTGKERDEESGLYYHGARYYAPWLARWTACDPLLIADGLNVYEYVRGNPVRLKDPSGRYSFDEFLDDAAAGVAGAARGIIEPALVVMDFGQMGAAMVTYAITDDPDDLDVQFLSGTGRRIAAADDPHAEGLRAGLVLATAMPTGGGSVLVDNIATVFEQDMSPEEARRFLVRGAVGQVVATGAGAGISRATGSGWTGRGSSAGDTALVERLVSERAANGETSTGRGTSSGRTYAVGRDGSGRTTPVRRSPAEGGDPHAEPQVLEDLGPHGGRTIAVDQVPCAECAPTLGAPGGARPGFFDSSVTGSLRVITPRRASSPGSSPKPAAIRAARALEQGGTPVELTPSLEFTVPYAPPIVPFLPRDAMSSDPSVLTPAEMAMQQCLPESQRHH
ncbi:SpvB/TcaC N-terminal domain-containing protein [Corallococcus exercitus]|uniref:SpvB/TcaC N-terminal domain-containing protein n=1 Tax=Corallococcus exercitus TaxID=2316736 RepID=UPI0035D3EE84